MRYRLLDYLYTAVHEAKKDGTPVLAPLWYHFPKDEATFGIDTQFLVGRDILVTPVLTPNVSTVAGVFPGRGSTIWRDWYTHKAVDVPSTPGANVTLDAPLGHINVHVRDGAAILLYAQPGYTITETAAGPYSLLVTLDKSGHAFGTAYVDDGETVPPTPNTTLTFKASGGRLTIHSSGNFHVQQKIESVTILGVGSSKPGAVKANEESLQAADWEYDEELERLVVKNLGLDLNGDTTVAWA